MPKNFDEIFVKTLILVLWIAPTSALFFFLNTLSSKDYIVFVCVIFGCNVVYDQSKRIIASPIKDMNSALALLKSGWLAIVVFLCSFSGVYIEAIGAVPTYIGVGLVWLPLYMLSLHLLSVTEKHFKATFGNGN